MGLIGRIHSTLNKLNDLKSSDARIIKNFERILKKCDKRKKEKRKMEKMMVNIGERGGFMSSGMKSDLLRKLDNKMEVFGSNAEIDFSLPSGFLHLERSRLRSPGNSASHLSNIDEEDSNLVTGNVYLRIYHSIMNLLI